jgi:hypothetical protein
VFGSERRKGAECVRAAAEALETIDTVEEAILPTRSDESTNEAERRREERTG